MFQLAQGKDIAEAKPQGGRDDVQPRHHAMPKDSTRGWAATKSSIAGPTHTVLLVPPQVVHLVHHDSMHSSLGANVKHWIAWQGSPQNAWLRPQAQPLACSGLPVGQSCLC